MGNLFPDIKKHLNQRKQEWKKPKTDMRSSTTIKDPSVRINNGVIYENTNINISLNLNTSKDVDLLAELISKLDRWNIKLEVEGPKVKKKFKFVESIDMFSWAKEGANLDLKDV